MQKTKFLKTVKPEVQEFSSTTLENDSRTKALYKELEEGSYSLDSSSLVSEIKMLHSNRKSRILIENSSRNTTKLIKALAQDSAYRSRIVEINVTCREKQEALKDHLDKLKNYLRIKYHNELKTEYKTITDRKAVIDSALFDANARLKEMDRVIKIGDMIMEDIDQTGWSMQRIAKIIEITTSYKERNT